ncbi:MAG: hypothetical protein D6734_13355 [Candidatus Schekmanbacteria bacterium]|nr:MAG: hypothetical protein D6734_13355 [Candidatus Schekmanbacteria bacterium]
MQRIKILFLLIFALSYPLVSFANPLDILVKKLVEKKIISKEDAKEILAEVMEEEKLQNEKEKIQVSEIRKQVKEEIENSQESLKEKILPRWVKNTKFSGDMRLRYERQESEENSRENVDRHRGRFRLRYGFETTINEKIKLGLRFASGSGEQTSTNQTFQDTFDQKNLWIDRAYIEYKPYKEFALIGGKMKNPFYTTDLVWDPDINPEGVALNFIKDFGNSTFFVRAGFFPIDESSSDSNDVSLYGIQGGFSSKLFGMDIKAAAAYYDWHNMKGAKLEDISPSKEKDTNSLIISDDGARIFKYNYRIIQPTFEITPLVFNAFERRFPVKIYCDFVNNIVGDVSDNTGWLAGIKVGEISKPGDFEISYNYRELEKDAVPAITTDSDFHGGGTNAKGHKISVKYSLMKNTIIGFTLFNTRSQEKKDNLKINWLQADLIVKF